MSREREANREADREVDREASREVKRQALLLSTLLRHHDTSLLAHQTRDGARFARGLAAYCANAGALAERALAVAFPVLRQLVGDASFAALARDHWQQHPPERGDIAQWGQALPAFVAAAPTLADEPYLGDVARLEWAMHEAASAADDDRPVHGFEALQDEACWPRLRLLARTGTQLVVSRHPIGAIVQAHAADAADANRFDAVRQAFAAGTAQSVLVWRDGWIVRHAVVAEAALAFTQGVLQGRGLLQNLKDSAAEFDFEAWLIDALHKKWLAGTTIDPEREEQDPCMLC